MDRWCPHTALGELIAIGTANSIDERDARPHHGVLQSEIRVIHATKGTLARAIWMSIAHDEIPETVHRQLVPRTLILLSGQARPIAAVALHEDEEALLAVDVLIMMIETDTMIHVTAPQSIAHIDHEAAHHLDGTERHEMNVTLIGEIVTTADSLSESTIHTLAPPVLRSPAYGHWIRTVDLDHLIRDTFQELQQDQHHIPHIMHPHPIDWVLKLTRTPDALLSLLIPNQRKTLAENLAGTTLFWQAAQKHPGRGTLHVLHLHQLRFRLLGAPMSGEHPYLMLNQVLLRYHHRNLFSQLQLLRPLQ